MSLLTDYEFIVTLDTSLHSVLHYRIYIILLFYLAILRGSVLDFGTGYWFSPGRPCEK